MSVLLKGCNFEHTELLINFLSFNDECAIVKEAKAKDANMLSQESKLTRANLQLNLCLKIDHPCPKTDTFSIA